MKEHVKGKMDIVKRAEKVRLAYTKEGCYESIGDRSFAGIVMEGV